MNHVFHPHGTLRGVGVDRSRPDLRMTVNLSWAGRELRQSYLLKGNDFYAQYAKVCRQLQAFYHANDALRITMEGTAGAFLEQFNLTTKPTTHMEAINA